MKKDVHRSMGRLSVNVLLLEKKKKFESRERWLEGEHPFEARRLTEFV